MAAFVDEMLRELPRVLAALEGTADDLVVYVGPVADERHFPTRPPQEPHHDVEGGQHPRMADVREVVDGDPAHVDADPCLANGSEVLLLVGERVEDAQRHGTLLPEPARRLRSTAAARGAAATLHDLAGGDRPAGESAVEDGLQIALDVVLVDALGQRELLDQEIPRRIEHLALAEAQILVELEQIEVAQHLRDLEHGAGLDLLHILAIAAVPSGGIDGDVLLLEDDVDLVDGFLVNERAEPHRPDLVDGDENFHPIFHDLEDIEGLPLAGDVLVLDPHHFADALPRVDGFVADLESLHRKGLLTRSAMGGQGWA